MPKFVPPLFPSQIARRLRILEYAQRPNIKSLLYDFMSSLMPANEEIVDEMRWLELVVIVGAALMLLLLLLMMPTNHQVDDRPVIRSTIKWNRLCSKWIR